MLGSGAAAPVIPTASPPKKARSRNREISQLQPSLPVTEVGRGEKVNILAVDGLEIKVRRK